jgi:hypothetical protein
MRDHSYRKTRLDRPSTVVILANPRQSVSIERSCRDYMTARAIKSLLCISLFVSVIPQDGEGRAGPTQFHRQGEIRMADEEEFALHPLRRDRVAEFSSLSPGPRRNGRFASPLAREVIELFQLGSGCMWSHLSAGGSGQECKDESEKHSPDSFHMQFPFANYGYREGILPLKSTGE